MIRFQTEHLFAAPPEVVWPHVRQTDWVNRAVGLPEVKYTITPRPEGGSDVMAEARIAGRLARWKEYPFEWIEPEFYRVRRVYEGGVMAEALLGLDLERAGTGTHVTAYAELEPKGVMGRAVAKWMVQPQVRRDMAQALAKLDAFLRGTRPMAFPDLLVTPVNDAALGVALKKLRASGQPEELVERLERFLREGADVEMKHIRPLAVARKWGRDGWDILRFFLHATRSGLFEFSSETLCPNCRSTRLPRVGSLAELKGTSHCDVCQIKFDAEFDKSVELKFGVNTAVRPCEERTFCLAGPGGKPHVVSQVWLEAGETRRWSWPRIKRRMRLYSPQVKEASYLEPETQVRRIVCEPKGFVVQEGQANGGTEMVNPNGFPVLVSWQEEAWSEDILTASRVTNWQEFHDLFASEVVSPTEQVTVGCQVILFTDLRGSTAMYSGLGDARAYVLVRNHFAVLMEAVKANRGRVVKTIGDAVMASFSRVDEALAAVRQCFAELPGANPGLEAPLVLKSSLHIGPCLAVNANDRLDFFGTTVNLGARMVECCAGNDLTVSDELFQRPETAEFVKHCGRRPEAAEIQCRGFSAPQWVWRIGMT